MININRYTTNLSTHLRALFLMVLLGTLWNCTSEDINDIPIVGGNEPTVTFSVRVPGGIPKLSSPTTYALSEDDENEIAQIAVLLFDTDGYTYQPIYVSGSNITGSGEVKTFTIKVPVGTYDMVVLANANASLSSALSNIYTGQSKADVLKELIVTNDGKWNATPTSGDYIPIPMWGESANINVAKGASVNASFTLVRMVAKIDVVLTTNTAKSKFDLQSVHLYNYYNQGHIAPTAGNWSGMPPTIKAPSVPVDATKPTNPIANPLIYDGAAITNEATGGISCINEIYTFEANVGSGSTLATNTCIVIGGKYNDESQATYYRIDFANTEGTGVDATTTYLPLLRNHHYKINIEDITASGLTSPEEAFKASPMNIKATVVNWSDALNVDVVYDGQYMLAVSQGEFTFSREQRTADSNDNTISITTDVPSGWKLEKIVDDAGTPITWLSLTSQKGASCVTSNTQFILSENNSGASRTAFVHLSAGRLTYIVKVVQLTTAKGILITDMSDKAIEILTFASKRGEQPAQQQFKLSWPDALTMSYMNAPTGNPFLFSTGAGLEDIPASGTLLNSTGEKTYTIQPPAITDAELASDPFYERTSNIIYSIPDGKSVITKVFKLRQFVYNMVPVIRDVYLMDGNVTSFGVRSNTPFTVVIKDNPDKVIDLRTNSGPSNTSAEGTRVLFQIKNEMDNPTLFQRDVVITIKSPLGLFPDTDVTLNCQSYEKVSESNSYIVTPQSYDEGAPQTAGIAIPVSRANQSMLGEQLQAGEAFTADLVWTDSPGNIEELMVVGTGPTGYIIVTPSLGEGNAVVAIKNTAGEILWSWHIWVTNYTPTPSAIGGFMDRNLGAIGNTPGEVGTKGLLYQWGRKDPFPGSNAIVNGDEATLYNEAGYVTIAKTNVATMDLSTSPNSNNFANSVANPATFYFNNAEPYNWYTNSKAAESRNDELWDDGTSTKTIYDPCPMGWRVPKNGAWSGLDKDNFEWNASNRGRTKDSHGGFYPASGYLSRNSGDLSLVGSYGYYWSATVNEGHAYALNFFSGFVYPSSNYYRAHGFSIRCVQE